MAKENADKTLTDSGFGGRHESSSLYIPAVYAPAGQSELGVRLIIHRRVLMHPVLHQLHD